HGHTSRGARPYTQGPPPTGRRVRVPFGPPPSLAGRLRLVTGHHKCPARRTNLPGRGRRLHRLDLARSPARSTAGPSGPPRLSTGSNSSGPVDTAHRPVDLLCLVW